MIGWIKVTNPEGLEVFLCVEQLIRVRQAVAGADFPAPPPAARPARDRKPDEPPAPQAVIDLTNGSQAVRETQKEVMELLKEAIKEAEKQAGA